MHFKQSSRGGLVTVLVLLTMLIMAYTELCDYWSPHYLYTFSNADHMSSNMQINLDMTVAVPCRDVTVDLRDVTGESVHYMPANIAKDSTEFLAQKERADTYVLLLSHTSRRKKMRLAQFVRKPNTRHPIDRISKRVSKYGANDPATGFAPTNPLVPDGEACRVYGTLLVRRVTGNLHITVVNKQMWSGMPGGTWSNTSHAIHELSFGVLYPDMAEPLDSMVTVAPEVGAVFQYFISVVPTRYLRNGKTEVQTQQYSATKFLRDPYGPPAVPGIYFRYDLEGLEMTVHKSYRSLVSFLVRLCAVLGGMWVFSSYGLRTMHHLQGAVQLLSMRFRGAHETPDTRAKPFDDAPRAPSTWDTSQSSGYATGTPHYSANLQAHPAHRTPSNPYN
ncbi:hypothetical protein MVES1_003154 [Malassezia vespertilionis]|uniref:uncharacterized protein n=1 Tax=Malassezia vespertilionis TaxID=2020962 RepID=UPI0024B08404|nr:uncharacterized protein MVES1_003154 [Malassezia vespertilionis]WFD07783.1 hypothetical protein MVES1_003154 [Malassezia vespertilionis]